MEIGIYITANIIYLVRELYLGDGIGSFSLLERRVVVAASFVGRHFLIVLWSLAGDVLRITCSFIALALDIHVFCLRAEAEGAILHTTKKFRGMRSEFSISCGRVQRVLVASPLLGVSIRIGMGCMNLVTAISRPTRVPVTLIWLSKLVSMNSIKGPSSND